MTHKFTTCQADRCKGSLRSHAEAVALGAIEQRIAGLVAELNIAGIVATVSSCEGHSRMPFPARRMALVGFLTDPASADELSARIKDDLLTAGQLHYFWEVDATFSAVDQLVFWLRCPAQYFTRTKPDEDFSHLANRALEIFRPRSQLLSPFP